MKKQDLLRIIDNELLEELFGFCYTRTKDSYEAEELCSDIVFALIKAACSNGEIENLYPFIWKVARNVYADFSDRRRKHTDMFYEGDSETVLPFIADEEDNDQSEELLDAVYRQIAFLTKAYREVMILFYLDGLSTAEIAVRQNISETAVRQRLFSARASLNRQIIERNAEELNGTDTGEYISWYTNDLKEAETQGFQNFYSAVDAVIKLTIGIAVLARIQWKLLICTLLTSGMFYVFSHYFHGNVEEESGKVSKGWETFTQAVKEQVGGVHVLKSFGHEMDFKENIQTASRELERQRCRYVKTREKAAAGKRRFSNSFWDNWEITMEPFSLTRWRRHPMIPRVSAGKSHILSRTYFCFTRRFEKTSHWDRHFRRKHWRRCSKRAHYTRI